LAGVEAIGVCYGMLGDNLPPPSEVIGLYNSYGIGAMRLYAPQAETLNALKGSNIDLMMGVPDEFLAKFAGDTAAATSWVNDNIVAYPDVSFKYCHSFKIDLPANNSGSMVFLTQIKTEAQKLFS
jgi:Glycosyl hydrolases family 17